MVETKRRSEERNQCSCSPEPRSQHERASRRAESLLNCSPEVHSRQEWAISMQLIMGPEDWKGSLTSASRSRVDTKDRSVRRKNSLAAALWPVVYANRRSEREKQFSYSLEAPSRHGGAIRLREKTFSWSPEVRSRHKRAISGAETSLAAAPRPVIDPEGQSVKMQPRAPQSTRRGDPWEEKQFSESLEARS